MDAGDAGRGAQGAALYKLLQHGQGLLFSQDHTAKRLLLCSTGFRSGADYSMRLDGSDKKKITDTPGGEFYPMVSPDRSSVSMSAASCSIWSESRPSKAIKAQSYL